MNSSGTHNALLAAVSKWAKDHPDSVLPPRRPRRRKSVPPVAPPTVQTSTVQQLERHEQTWIDGRRAEALGLLKRRAFLAAAGAGAFPVRGRRPILALRGDVEAYVRSLAERRARKTTTAGPQEDVDAELSRMLDAGRLTVLHGGKAKR